jgi:hypothetical protein
MIESGITILLFGKTFYYVYFNCMKTLLYIILFINLV